ncbi:hypothetical protein Pla108_35760 [Botrimarina colliarenosi]|uniref:Matrixin n=1 Tax=Botrimarina colliarenosi TaxID=2528001 RepID=A0A5C6A802_9BACT|nr:Ig-like domain-containing protein [Botrimarina colliarenosi]TWT95428.1 hypothetical protein Pla108_35760 [Botrimarina colliarenosi]
MHYKRHRTSPTRRRGHAERLEPRLALDSQGLLAGFDPHFTLSFADDGVLIGDEPSSLNATLDAIAPRNEWREAALTAFQKWAIHTNSDIAVVSDGGQPFGAPGASQGDARFGDIRLGATTLSPEVGAVSVPIDNVASGTWLAEVVVNSAFDYQTIDDVLAVLTHEAGNVFGLKDNDDPNSPLHTGAAPAVRDPTPGDIAALQAIHGARAPDPNEQHDHQPGGPVSNNDTPANATRLDLASAAGYGEGSAPTIVFGDVGTVADIDYFTIDSPGDYTGTTTVQLRTSGVSLLQPALTIVNGAGEVVSQALSNAIGGSVLTVQLPATSSDETYTLRVSGADLGVFGVGGYSLAVTFDGLNRINAQTINDLTGGAFQTLSSEDLAKRFDPEEDDYLNDDGGTNETAELGSELTTTSGFVEGARYDVLGSIVGGGEVDYYKIQSPPSSAGPRGVMTVAVRSLDAGRLTPAVSVFDEDDQPVATETIVNGSGQLIVQATEIDPGKDYFVRVEAADGSGAFTEGNYDLRVTFGADAVVLETTASGAVGGSVGVASHTLYVGRPQLFHFALEAGDALVSGPAAVVAIVRDGLGQVITRVAAPPGETRTAPAVLLDPGEHTVEFFAVSLGGVPLPSVAYTLRAQVLSDPFVGDPDDPTGNPFACSDPELAGFFCYPGGFVSADPFLWDDFVDSLPDPPSLDLGELVDLVLGDWWSWVWEQIGLNGPTLTQNDRFDIDAIGGAAQVRGFARATAPLNVLANDFDPEGEAVVAVLLSGPDHGQLTLDPNGTVHYTPDLGYHGTDRFTYTAYDFVQESMPAAAYLVVGSGVSGDYSGNGVVDAADADVWRAAYGSTDDLSADGNKNSVVDAADYTIWRDAFDSAAQIGSSGALAAQPPADEVAAPTEVPQSFREPFGQTMTRSIAAQRSADPLPHTEVTDNALLLLFGSQSRPQSSVEMAEPPVDRSKGQPIAVEAASPGGRHLRTPVRPLWRASL